MAGIYGIRNNVNQKIYVGSAVNIKRRWKEHRTLLRKGAHHSRKHRASEETREKIRQSRIGKRHKPETCELLRVANLGRKHSAEHRDKLRRASTGRFYSAETRQKISDGHKGKTIPLDVREKISKTLKGITVPAHRRAAISRALTGRPRTEETKAKISAAQKGCPHETARALSFGDAQEIRSMKKAGAPYAQMIERFGCNRGTIYGIVSGKTYLFSVAGSQLAEATKSLRSCSCYWLSRPSAPGIRFGSPQGKTDENREIRSLWSDYGRLCRALLFVRLD